MLCGGNKETEETDKATEAEREVYPTERTVYNGLYVFSLCWYTQETGSMDPMAVTTRSVWLVCERVS